MVQETTNEQQSQNQPKREILRDQKLLFLGIGAVVICALVAFLTVKYAVSSTSKSNYPNQMKNQTSRIGPLFDAGEFTTNLAQGGEKRFVRIRVVFELNQQSLEEEVEQKLPVLRDNIFLFLNSKTSEDLGAEKRLQLKEELLVGLNKYLSRGKIKNIYFSDLVMQ